MLLVITHKALAFAVSPVIRLGESYKFNLIAVPGDSLVQLQRNILLY